MRLRTIHAVPWFILLALVVGCSNATRLAEVEGDTLALSAAGSPSLGESTKRVDWVEPLPVDESYLENVNVLPKIDPPPPPDLSDFESLDVLEAPDVSQVLVLRTEPRPVMDFDTPVLSAEDAERYHAMYEATLKGISESKGGLTVDRAGVWSPRDANHLTFCVSTEFGAHHGEVVRALQVAAADWAASASVRFTWLPSEDARCSPLNSSVTFDVRPTRAGTFIAVAFFPSFARSERTLWIHQENAFEGLSGLPFSLTGILRHELGHVLGLRHEHVRSTSAARCAERRPFLPVTEYDPLSVMHYPWCDGKNAGDLTLSVLDRAGIALLYPPDACNNGEDDDQDEMIDEGCPAALLEDCGNGVDDDRDGRNDDSDPDCARPETCNGRDDDFNGAVDDLPACHRVILRFDNVDDTGRAWFNTVADANIVCDVDSGAYPRHGECNLSESMRVRGNPDFASFVVRLGNGGGFNSSGNIALLIDGRVVFSHSEAAAVRGLDWFYSQTLTVDFRHGTLLF